MSIQSKPTQQNALYCWMKAFYNVILRIARNLLETKENIKIESHPFYHKICDWFSWGWSKKKIQNGRLKKTEFFNSPNSQNFFTKMSWIGSWVSMIDWCGRHWCGSTWMVVRLSEVSSKTGKKCIFCVFRLFLSLCHTASWPYRLSHINALGINQSY
jgi:hypothetical protein